MRAAGFIRREDHGQAPARSEPGGRLGWITGDDEGVDPSGLWPGETPAGEGERGLFAWPQLDRSGASHEEPRIEMRAPAHELDLEAAEASDARQAGTQIAGDGREGMGWREMRGTEIVDEPAADRAIPREDDDEDEGGWWQRESEGALPAAATAHDPAEDGDGFEFRAPGDLPAGGSSWADAPAIDANRWAGQSGEPAATAAAELQPPVERGRGWMVEDDDLPVDEPVSMRRTWAWGFDARAEAAERLSDAVTDGNPTPGAARWTSETASGGTAWSEPETANWTWEPAAAAPESEIHAPEVADASGEPASEVAAAEATGDPYEASQGGVELPAWRPPAWTEAAGEAEDEDAWWEASPGEQPAAPAETPADDGASQLPVDREFPEAAWLAPSESDLTVKPDVEPVADTPMLEEPAAEPLPAPAFFRVEVCLDRAQGLCEEPAAGYDPETPLAGVEDVVLQSIAWAIAEWWGTEGGESIAIVQPARGGEQLSMVHGAARLTPAEIAAQRRAAPIAETACACAVYLLGPCRLDEGATLPDGHAFAFSLGRTRERLAFVDRAIVAQPVATVSIIYRPSALPLGDAASMLGRIRELIEQPGTSGLR
ncbi:MAG: hypothetical protein AB7O57_13540 [Hyphomicrobiaceae bacterium]